jgi:transcriptional regulator with XRE-family HTH domain
MGDGASHVGATIRVLRKASGFTQPQLARRANVSVSLLGKVECGDRAATHSLLAALARALRVPLERLTGQPYADDRNDAATHAVIDALREVLRRADLPSDLPARPVNELAADVAVIAQLRRDADYRKLAAHLPSLIEELTAATHEANTTSAVGVYRLLVTTYYATHGLLHRLGFADLAESVEHKLTDAAHRASDPLAGGLAQWARAQGFQSAGDYTHGLTLMDGARADLDDELRQHPSPAALTVYGSLHLRSVTLASRAGDATATRDHIDAASELAQRLGGRDQVHYGLTFGHANTITHETAAHVELGDGATALRAAETWSPPRTMPRTRRGHHYIDLARAHLIHGDRTASLTALQQAQRIAPQQTRLHPMVRETTAVLISLHRRSNPDLTRYARWVGLT